MAGNLATKYMETVKEHPYGYALFRPALSKDLQPGCCGYVDDNGKWNPILPDIRTTTDKGFSASRPLSAMHPQSHTWGPKASAGVVHKRIAFEGGADALAAGYPMDVRLAVDFSATSEFGAVLHCEKGVTESGFHHRKPFKDWALANAQAILTLCPDVKKRKVCVVASTFEAQEVDINAWSGKNKTVSMGFKAGATGAGEIGPSGQFVKIGSSSEWNHDALKVSTRYRRGDNRLS